MKTAIPKLTKKPRVLAASAAAEGGHPEEPQVDQRIGEPSLPAHERHSDGEAARDRRGRRPTDAVLGDLLEAVDHRQHGDQRCGGADQIEPAGLGIAVLG